MRLLRRSGGPRQALLLFAGSAVLTGLVAASARTAMANGAFSRTYDASACTNVAGSTTVVCPLISDWIWTYPTPTTAIDLTLAGTQYISVQVWPENKASNVWAWACRTSPDGATGGCGASANFPTVTAAANTLSVPSWPQWNSPGDSFAVYVSGLQLGDFTSYRVIAFPN